MRIGAVSERLGISASAIRYYERIGLIGPLMRLSGCRVFDSRAVLTLQFIKLGQAAGFSIEEIKALLESYQSNPHPPAMWRPRAQAKREILRKQMRDLERMEQVLQRLLECGCETVEDCLEMSQQTRSRSRR